MAHTPIFDRLVRAMRIAAACNDQGISTAEGLERAAAAEDARATRRRFLASLGTIAAAGAAGSLIGARSAWAAPKGGPQLSVGIIGAGLAGLCCADELKRRGILATVYEAETSRVGGRQWSSSAFAGQVFERGGELIDNPHKTMLGLANRFGLTRELQWRTFGGEETFLFGGVHYTEAQIVDEVRDFFDAMHDDLRDSSFATTADAFTPYDRTLDLCSLEAYFNGGGPTGIAAGPIAKAALGSAYLAEYGRDLSEQSTLNFLYFAKSSRQSKFEPFGTFSDERYHILEGNDRIAKGLRDGLSSGQLQPGMRLTAARKASDGRIVLSLRDGNRTVERTHDAVVIAIPFSVLRGVALHTSLGLPEWKVLAIQQLGYGDNAKCMVRFNGRPWAAHGSVGVSYSDQANHQATWETNPSLATSSRAILTDYSSAARGRALSPDRVQQQVGAFLADLENVWSGSAAAAARDGAGNYIAHLESWPRNPLSQGSYTCYLPGQFTTIAGNEGKAVGNLFFAGEHCDSFYDWQGFMEGACNSGIAAAAGVLALV